MVVTILKEQLGLDEAFNYKEEIDINSTLQSENVWKRARCKLTLPGRDVAFEEIAIKRICAMEFIMLSFMKVVSRTPIDLISDRKNAQCLKMSQSLLKVYSSTFVALSVYLSSIPSIAYDGGCDGKSKDPELRPSYCYVQEPAYQDISRIKLLSELAVSSTPSERYGLMTQKVRGFNDGCERATMLSLRDRRPKLRVMKPGTSSSCPPTYGLLLSEKWLAQQEAQRLMCSYNRVQELKIELLRRMGGAAMNLPEAAHFLNVPMSISPSSSPPYLSCRCSNALSGENSLSFAALNVPHTPVELAHSERLYHDLRIWTRMKICGAWLICPTLKDPHFANCPIDSRASLFLRRVSIDLTRLPLFLPRAYRRRDDSFRAISLDNADLRVNIMLADISGIVGGIRVIIRFSRYFNSDAYHKQYVWPLIIPVRNYDWKTSDLEPESCCTSPRVVLFGRSFALDGPTHIKPRPCPKKSVTSCEYSGTIDHGHNTWPFPPLLAFFLSAQKDSFCRILQYPAL
ncbi:hypothetical protein Tco_1437904 [Tanacetum coccineum]